MNMNFDLGDLRAFIAVAELASFRAAAETIHLSQPALSRRIDKLEDALGVRLFDRDTRNVELTAVGRDFARKSRSLLDDLDTILLGMRDVAANRWGQVTLACIPSTVHYFLPAVLQQYHGRFPRIRVHIIDESANEVLAAVAHGEAELGLNMTGSDEPTIEFEPLLSVPIVDPEVTRTVGLIKRRGRSLSPAAEHLHEMLRAVALRLTRGGKGPARAPSTSATLEAPAPRGARTRSRRTAAAQ